MTTMTTIIPMYPTHYPTTENFRSARALLRCHLAESVAPVVTVAAVVAAAPLVQALAAAVVAEFLTNRLAPTALRQYPLTRGNCRLPNSHSGSSKTSRGNPKNSGYHCPLPWVVLKQ